jgi:phospholipid N-methyltransferase
MDMQTTARHESALRRRRIGIFARNFFRHPLSVGTIAPSSPFVVDRVLEQAPWERAAVVVEYGPGVGTMSSPILARMRPDARLLLIETNAEFVDYLRDAYADDERVIVELASAADVATLLARHRLPKADAIVSGIPFSTLPPEVREAVLDGTLASLRKGGRFVVYQYTRAVLKHIDGRFRVENEQTEWRNTWPARIFDLRPSG